MVSEMGRNNQQEGAENSAVSFCVEPTRRAGEDQRRLQCGDVSQPSSVGSTVSQAGRHIRPPHLLARRRIALAAALWWLGYVAHARPLAQVADIARVDLIEHNHVYDAFGVQWRFDVWVYRRWDSLSNHHEIVAWRWASNNQQGWLPAPVWEGGFWRQTFRDSSADGMLRQVVAPEMVATFSNFDVELHERGRLRVSQREGL